MQAKTRRILRFQGHVLRAHRPTDYRAPSLSEKPVVRICRGTTPEGRDTYKDGIGGSGSDGLVWLQVPPPESSHESEVGGPVHLGCPPVLDRVVVPDGILLDVVMIVDVHVIAEGRVDIQDSGCYLTRERFGFALFRGDGPTSDRH